MLKTRIIPKLDIKGPNLVKGIHFEGLRVLGSPEDFAQYYYENGADELVYSDVVASLFGRNSLNDIISKTASKTFIPITVGGGIRSIDDIRQVLRIGADKISLNTAAINNPELIRQASTIFGKSTIVITVEVIREKNGDYMCYTDNGREITNKNVFSWVKEVESLGAGEIMLSSVDKDGTREGFDIEVVKKIVESVDIPVVIHGGFGKLEHLDELIKNVIPSGISIASSFHYDAMNKIKKSELILNEGNYEFLKKSEFSKTENFSIFDVKNRLSRNLNVRL